MIAAPGKLLARQTCGTDEGMVGRWGRAPAPSSVSPAAPGAQEWLPRRARRVTEAEKPPPRCPAPAPG